MKIKDLVLSEQIVACERNRLTSFLSKVQEKAAVRTEDNNPDEPDDIINDYYSAIYPPRPSMIINEETGVAIIPVRGMITKGLSVFEQRYYGCCDVDDISEMIDAAANNIKITKVIFDFDSPGGYISGVPELAEKIASLTAMKGKQTVAYTEDIMASAAYWLAAQCGTIACTPSAYVGSIGVYCTYLDLSGMAEQMGIKVRVFASGKYKGMGQPGTSLTQDQADFIQANINASAARFKNAITSMRPAVSEETMQGQCFYGEDSLLANLVDQLVLPGAIS